MGKKTILYHSSLSRDRGSSPCFWDAWVFLGMSNNAQSVMRSAHNAHVGLSTWRSSPCAAPGSPDVVEGIWVRFTPFLHVSFSNCWPSSLLPKQTCYMAFPNKWTKLKRVRTLRCKKSCRFKKDFWAAVQQAGCFISMCVTPIAFSTACYMLLRRQLVFCTLKWSI